MDAENDTLLENYPNAWKGLHMIREAVETLGPPGVLPSQEAVLTLYGPEPVHEAQAIVGALTKILNPEIKTILNPEVQELREAVYPFTFPSYPESFQGDDESMTNALINDPDVQRARRVMGRLKEHSRRKSDRHV